jgi:2-C-methyl-D-erythritol 2,4-cyclodiphosphate synthase
MISIRTGIGYDVHKLVEGRPLIIGGISVPHSHGLLGHSDADVLLHALGDALLGAAGLGDLGQHFPDTDARYAGANSKDLITTIMSMLDSRGYVVGNVDAIVVAQAPRLAPYREAMVQTMAQLLCIDVAKVNLKATTEEGLGFTGSKQGISAWANVLIHTQESL